MKQTVTHITCDGPCKGTDLPGMQTISLPVDRVGVPTGDKEDVTATADLCPECLKLAFEWLGKKAGYGVCLKTADHFKWRRS